MSQPGDEPSFDSVLSREVKVEKGRNEAVGIDKKFFLFYCYSPPLSTQHR